MTVENWHSEMPYPHQSLDVRHVLRKLPDPFVCLTLSYYLYSEVAFRICQTH